MSDSGTLILHCGGEAATYDQVMAVETPEATATHVPIPHNEFLTMVDKYLEGGGFEIVDRRHALAKDGQRYFGVYGLRNQGMGGTYQWAVGIRNAHDKSYRAAVVAGVRVFVCDNLAFSGEIQVVRKHTKHAVRDLGNMMSRAVGQLGDKFHKSDDRYRRYREHDLVVDSKDVHDILVRAVDVRAITPYQLPTVLQEWREPSVEAFSNERNAWGLFNAFTYGYKKLSDSNVLVNRNQALHGLFDTVCGFATHSES